MAQSGKGHGSSLDLTFFATIQKASLNPTFQSLDRLLGTYFKNVQVHRQEFSHGLIIALSQFAFLALFQPYTLNSSKNSVPSMSKPSVQPAQ
jgi:hypothetical protein